VIARRSVDEKHDQYKTITKEIFGEIITYLVMPSSGPHTELLKHQDLSRPIPVKYLGGFRCFS